MKLTNEQRAKVIDGLAAIKEGRCDSLLGICFNLHYRASGELRFPNVLGCGMPEIDGYDIVEHYSQDWELYTGTPDYPVPDVPGPRWEGNNKVLRFRLIDHMITRLRAEMLVNE
jgi:hypothetical protein